MLIVESKLSELCLKTLEHRLSILEENKIYLYNELSPLGFCNYMEYLNKIRNIIKARKIRRNDV